MNALDRNPARFSSGAIVVGGGGIPFFNAEDGALGAKPSKANFLSSLQLSLQNSGMAPAAIYGFKPSAPQPWYRPDLQANPAAQIESWNAYVDGANMGTYRGGLLGLIMGGGIMLAALYFGGAMTSSPKSRAATPAARPTGVVTASSHHRRARGRHHGR
jgi:hypothetical protein